MMRENLIDLVFMKQTAERYLQYLRFTGQNFHIMGCIQYNQLNTPFIPKAPVNSSRIGRCMRTILANVLEMVGVKLAIVAPMVRFF